MGNPGVCEQIRAHCADDHTGQHVRHAWQNAPAEKRARERCDADRRRPAVDLLDMAGELRQRGDQGWLLRQRQAEKIAQLCGDDQQTRTCGEADDDGGRDEIHQHPESGRAERELDQPDHQVERQNQPDVIGRERDRKSTDGREHHQRCRVGRPRHQMPRRPP